MNQMAVNRPTKLVDKYGIAIDQLDFSYVAKCEDPKVLKHIIQVLESGEEGHYQTLLVATEARLRQIKPDASILNRKLGFAQKYSDLSTCNDYDDDFDDIAKWIKKSNQQEKEIQSVKQSPTSHLNGHDEQPVRRSINLTSMFNSEQPEQDLSISKPSSVYHESLETSYSKWDKYDSDVELIKLENKEKIEKLQTQKKKNMNLNCLSVGSNDTSNTQGRSKSVKYYLDSMYRSNSALRPQDLALRAKLLGNECFQSHDFNDALGHYNASISIHSTPEAKNNRAMTLIKLMKFEEALDDLREVIERDPKNVKAHFRKGMCYKTIYMYCLALRSFEAALKCDCNNIKALNIVKELKNLISNIPPKNLIRVREITRHYDQTVWDIEDPFYVSYMELNELNKEYVEYLYEADSSGCLTKCVCNLCPWHEWQQRKKKWSCHKMFKNETPRKRWELLTSNIIPLLQSKSLTPEIQKPKRLDIVDVNSAKMNGHNTNLMTTHKNGVVNGANKSPCKHCEDDEFNLKPVSSVREFLENWKTASQKNNFEIYNKLLRCIKPNDLPKVISANLNEEIMSTFLETLNKKFDHERELDLISEYLTAMTKVKRFSLIVKMLDNKVKESFRPLVKLVHSHTKNNTFLVLL